MVRPKTIHLHEDAFFLWCQGLPVVDVAEKVGTTIGTIYSWRKREDWDERKKEIPLRDKINKIIHDKEREKLDITHTVYHKITTIIEESTTGLLNCSKVLAQAGSFVISGLIREGKSFPTELEQQNFFRVNTDLFARWTRILKDAASIQKAVVPEGSEELFNAILQEIEDIEKSGEVPKMKVIE